MRPPSEGVMTILRYLRALEQRGGGYEMHGVDGWAGLQQITDGTGVLESSDALRAAVRRNYVDRADARVPDVGSPFYIYRISQAGLTELVRGEEGGTESMMIKTPKPGVGNRRVHLTDGMVAALDAMRAARTQPGKRDRVPGQPEWRTSMELTNCLQAEGEHTGKARVFFTEEMQRLVRYGLAERRSDDAGNFIYRITEVGALLEPLEWK